MNYENRFFWLDLVRGISAFAVCAGHLRAVLLYSYSKIETPSLCQKLFYTLTGLGHQAVVVFFVLSGFFVGGAVLRKGAEFNWRDYCIARLTRLWVVLIPVLLFTLTIDTIINKNMPEVFQGAYYNIWNSGPKDDYSLSLATFFGNVFFLQTIVTPVFGSNGPLWSLANEFWYYALFPAFATSFSWCGRSNLLIRISMFAVAIFLLLFPLQKLQSGFFIWMMGVVSYIACDKLSKKNSPIMLTCALFIFVFSLLHSRIVLLQHVLPIENDIFIALCFTFLCTILACSPGPNNMLLMKFSTMISNFSYSLYLSHFPLLIFIASIIYKGVKKELYGFSWAIHYVSWLFFLNAVGLLFYFLFEKHTKAIRKLF